MRDNYFINRLKQYGISSIPNDWKDTFYSDCLIDNFINDTHFMCTHTTQTTSVILGCYDTVVFENGQGLLLDQNATFYGDNTTPSNTGSINSYNILSKTFDPKHINVELCYVSRSYMTRHGTGRFETECNKALINPNMIDLTNVGNTFQGELRYGELNINNLIKRVKADSTVFERLPNVTTSLAITHTNELPVDLSKFEHEAINSLYTSDSKYRENIHMVL